MPLRVCYNRIRQSIGHNIVESFESVELVEKYRQYWKPDNVRIVLLAESHLLTSENDRRVTVPAIANLQNYPTEYAKFVYCLAYGERELTGNPLHPTGDGTPQYWKVFYSCINHVREIDNFSPINGNTPFAERLNNKIAVLQAMKARGIWLVDSSIIALYDNGRIYNNGTDKRIIKTSWECYRRNQIEQAQPAHIIIIGKGVADVLEVEIRRLTNSHTVVAQPNAFLSAAEHLSNYKLYGKICCNTC